MITDDVSVLDVVTAMQSGRTVRLTTRDNQLIELKPEVLKGQLSGNFVSTMLPGIAYDDPRIVVKETMVALEEAHRQVKQVVL